MAEVTVFGSFPKVVPMKLSTGQDFSMTFTNKPGGVTTNWPAGAALSIVFDSGTTWNATVATSTATWSVNKAVADLITEGTTYRLTYTDTSGNDLVPYKGPVYRDDSQS